MANYEIRSAVNADFQQLAVLMAEQNEIPERQCIHSGVGAAAIRKQLEIYEADGEMAFVLVEAEDNGRLIGAFGAEYDESLGWAWLWGPFAPHDINYQLSEPLYEALLHQLPSTIKRLNSYLNLANQWGGAFYQKVGFELYTTAHVFVAEQPEFPPQADRDCALLTPPFEAAFLMLHHEVFPETHTSGQTILQKLDNKSNRIYVMVNDQELLGYVHAAVDQSSGEGYIEFIGVKATARGQGIGRRLMQTALAWLFIECSVPQVGLNVRENLANARSLYESVGFRLRYTGVAMRKDL